MSNSSTGATTATSPAQIGFIGLGAMGLGMAQTLVRAGYTVHGYDLNPQAVEGLVQSGGMAADSPIAAATGAELVILMVLNAEQVNAILFGENGIVGALSPDAIVMICSTVSPAFVQQVAQRLQDTGVHLLDAPVSGGTRRAADGTLSLMVAGAPHVRARAEGVLRALGENIYVLGDSPGQGATMKLVNQVLAGIHLAAAAEAMALGARAGLDPRLIFEVISNSAGNSWMFQNRVPHILDNDYTPQSAVEIWLKDLGLVVDTGKELKVPTPLAATAQQMFVMAAAAGHGRLDDAAVVKVYEQIAGFRVVSSQQAEEPDSTT